MTLISTPGATDANSYASLAEAQAYVDTLSFVPPEWTAATNAQKEGALIQATRWLDTIRWKGVKSNRLQSLTWPRYGMVDRDGYVIYSPAIPQILKDAQCEFAIRLIAEDRVADAGALVPETLKIGSLDLGKLRHSLIPDSVLLMLRPFLASTGGMIGGARG